MMHLKNSVLSLLLLVSFNALSYENTCESIFTNGIQAHSDAIIQIRYAARLLNGSTHELYAKQLKLPRWSAGRTCGDFKCTKNDTSSTAIPAYSFKEYISPSTNGRKKHRHHFDEGYWFSNLTIPNASYETVTIKPFSTVKFQHNTREFIAKNLVLRTGSTVIMKPGDYWIENVHLSTGSAIELSGPGQVRIFTKSFHTSFANTMGVADAPQSLLVISDKLDIGTSSTVHGFFYAHEKANFDGFSSLNGAVSAKQLQLKTNADITYEKTASHKVNYAWLCDYDKDGIYDGFDDDSDNDGFTDEVERLAGSDIYNAEDLPSDLDSDGIPDVLDDDIDGDGYSNEKEIEDGTDPYDPGSYLAAPPSIELTIESGQVIERDNIHVSGKITFGDLPIAKLYVYNIQVPDQLQLIDLNTDGGFTSTLNLNEGLNEFSFIAEDTDGTQVQAAFNATYIVPFQILSITPSTSSTFDTETIQIIVKVKSDIVPQLRINSLLASIESAVNGIHTFHINYDLLPGNNDLALQVLSGSKTLNAQLQYRYEPSDTTQYPAPQININAPSDNTITAQNQTPLIARITSNVGNLSAAVEGAPVQLVKNSENQYSLFYPLDLQEGDNLFTVQVTDGLDQVTNQTVSVKKDTTPPSIGLSKDYLLPPEINILPNTQFIVEGTVTGGDVASLSIAGQQVQLNDNASSIYHFSHALNIVSNQDVLVGINAKDKLGNKNTLAYYFHATSNLNMKWISPVFPVSWILENLTAKPFAIKLLDSTGNEEFIIELSNDGTVIQTINSERVGNVLTGTLPKLTEKGTYTLTVKALEADNEVTRLTSQLNIVSQEDIPLEVTKVLPIAEQENLEPDTFLQVNVNRPIDINKLTIEARRTLHGKTYVNLDASGTDFLHAKGMQLIQVDVDRELIAGNISVLPDDSSFIFYPQQDFGYTADVDWQVFYDGKLLSKQRFSTRTLPTVIDGGVQDSFGQTIEGITVEIEELGVITQTNNDGGYSFGYGASASENIPQGRYHLLVNRDFKFSKLGEVRIPVDIKEGRRNQFSILKVPNLNDDIQWISVTKDTPKVRLSGGEVELELAGAKLQFPTERTAIHAQFIPTRNNVREVYEGAAPLWFYQLQPFGIKPSKPIHIKIKVPLLNGSDNYMLLQKDQVGYAFLLGYNPTKNIIEPVGVMKIKNGYMNSMQPIALETLDYLGYTHTLPKYQERFKQYELGQISFIELVAEVTAE